MVNRTESLKKIGLIIDSLNILEEDRFVVLNTAVKLPDVELDSLAGSLKTDRAWVNTFLKNFYSARLAALENDSQSLKRVIGEIKKSAE